MPILLTTPKTFDPGHGADEETYAIVTMICFEVKIVERLARFVMQYGNYVAPDPAKPAEVVWVPGGLENLVIIKQDKPAVIGSGIDPADGLFKTQEITPADPQFTDMSAQLALPAVGASLDALADVQYLMALGNDLYQYFIDDGHYAGTVI